jgi:hypothetical protein
LNLNYAVAGTQLLNDLYILDLRNSINTWRKVSLVPSTDQGDFTLLSPFDSKLQIVDGDLVITATGGLRLCAHAPQQPALLPAPPCACSLPLVNNA